MGGSPALIADRTEGNDAGKSCDIRWTFVTVGGIGMVVSPFLVGSLRDVSGVILPGFLICAVAGWSLLAAGIFMPRGSFGATNATS